MTKPIRCGMVGGGEGAFIGGVHRAAMRLDGLWDLQAASLCSDPDRSLASAEAISIDRGYGTWQEMLDAEVGQLDCITVVTPNDSHAEIATAALDKGFHVMLDKPMTRTLAEAELLAAVAAGLWFQSLPLALIMAAAMIVNLVVAGLAGAAIPLGLALRGIDPAVASAVFLTTITDVVGFFAFLGLAAWLLL